MKTIKGVDDKLTHWNDDAPADVLATMPSYRKMLREAVAMGLAKSGENALDLIQIGLKLKLAEPDIPLEDAEFKLLKERCGQNPCNWQAFFQGQVLLKLIEAEKA